MTCGIYKITNTIDGKVYIGSSVDVRGRFNSHRSDLRQNKHGNSKLQRAWKKHGEEAFVFEIIEECAPGDVRDIEQRYLDELFIKSDRNEFYNLYSSACGLTPEQAREENLKRWSDPEFKAKASASFKKTWSDPELLARHREACKNNYEKIADIDGWKEKQHIAHNTDDYKQRSAERAKQQWSDPETRAKMMNSLSSEESRAKKSVAAKKISLDPEFKRKHREGIEKSFTPERRADLSRYPKEYFSDPENRHKQRLNSPHRKQIMCNETGVVYDSIAQAAKSMGVSVRSIKMATRPGRTCKNLTFKYLR
jgi:group I intron endonuclease